LNQEDSDYSREYDEEPIKENAEPLSKPSTNYEMLNPL
jgi:hypothetical protein